jgi:hypothetical protein
MNKFVAIGGMVLIGYIGHKIGYINAVIDSLVAVRKTTEEHLTEKYPDTRIVVDTRHNAEELYCELQDNIEKYGLVTIKDLYKIAGFDANLYNDLAKWGWRDISATRIIPVKYGYTLKLPRPVVID